MEPHELDLGSDSQSQPKGTTPESLNPCGATVLRHGLQALRVGEPSAFRLITVFPLFLPDDVGPEYVSLDEAMATEEFRVTEVSPSGSVPNLRVTNKCGHSVLIIDGEELLGAKQNRVVNLTLLIPAGFDDIIPVSCTERGRWRPTSTQFSASDIVMELKTRRAKAASVSNSLADTGSYSSDQGGVWDSIQKLEAKSKHTSPTNSMHDVYSSCEAEVANALATFPLQPSQHGLLVFLNGRPAGLDVVSRAHVYNQLHPKLARSYVLDALLDETQPDGPPVAPETADAFLRAVTACPALIHPSVGLGGTARAKGSGIVGSALVYIDALIHAAYFGTAATDSSSQPVHRVRSSRPRPRRDGPATL